MSHRALARPNALLAAFALSIAACSDPVAAPAAADPSLSAVKFWEAGSTVAWNRTAREFVPLYGAAGGRPLTPIVEARVLTYLSIAQHNAITAAEAATDRGRRPSPAAAAAGASVAVLRSLLDTDAHPALDARLQAQLDAARWPGEQETDAAAGVAIGNEIGAAVAAYAATDGAETRPAPPNTGGWTGTNPFRGLYGARTLVLQSADQFMPPPPPAPGSPEFAAALAEVQQLAEGRANPEKNALIDFWAPKGIGYMNGVAADLIVAQHRSEREAARILALANMAGFDALNACFEAKFAYYFIRPTQVSGSGVKLGTGLPNHPSYPSGHSCLTASLATVLAGAFPSERARLEGMIEDAGMSRIYAGLHYRFDCEAGQELGRQVARWVLEHGIDHRAPIALD